MADSTFHAIRRGGYTHVDNDIFKHGMSARAIGVIALMLSKPPGWRFASERIATEVSEGREAIRTALRELETVGFIKRRKIGGTNPETVVYLRDSLEVPWPWEEPQVSSTAQKPDAGNLGPLVTTEEVTNTYPQPKAEDVRRERNFDEFWSMYPRKVEKKAARRAFTKIDFIKGENLPAVIASALQRRIEWWTAMETPPDKIPHASTWLNGERWNDEIEPVTRLPQKRSSHTERHAAAAELVDRAGGGSVLDALFASSDPAAKELNP